MRPLVAKTIQTAAFTLGAGLLFMWGALEAKAACCACPEKTGFYVKNMTTHGGEVTDCQYERSAPVQQSAPAPAQQPAPAYPPQAYAYPAYAYSVQPSCPPGAFMTAWGCQWPQQPAFFGYGGGWGFHHHFHPRGR